MSKFQEKRRIREVSNRRIEGVPADAGKYVPPAAMILRGLGIEASDLSGDRVTVSPDYLRFLISKVADMAPFDETWYLENNPDVEGAFLAGDLPSPRSHFLETGYFEGRLPCALPCDTAWYFAQYKDLGQVFSGSDSEALLQHYHTRGYFEGRAGTPAELEVVEQWAKGEPSA